MKPSSSQVLDHQLLFHIIYGLDNFIIIGQKKERRGEGRVGVVEYRGEERVGIIGNNSIDPNIEWKMCQNKPLPTDYLPK
jgi:hypothetical protein